MTIATQLLVLYFFLPDHGIAMVLEFWQILLLIFATALLTASGNVINDIHDTATDAINKPQQLLIGKRITEKRAYNFYFILTITAVVAGFVLANSIAMPSLASLFIMVSFGLYAYAVYLKRLVLIGNLLISLLVGLVIITAGLFALLPTITTENSMQQLALFQELSVFALFAFIVNLLREGLKDCQDVSGDHATGRNSLPIVLGRQRAGKVWAVYSLILVIIIGYLATIELYRDTLSLYYTLFLILGPLLLISIKLWTVEQNREFKILSLVCKFILLLGMIGIAIIKF